MTHNLTQELARMLLDELLSDPEKWHNMTISSMKVLTVADVAFLLGRDSKTVRRWHQAQKYGFRMNVGPEQHLTMTYKDFKEWYDSQYKKPAPKL